MTAVIERTMEINASVETVWKAITDPASIAAWFGDTAELDLRPGGKGTFGWEAHGQAAVEIEEIDPPRRISWRWAKELDKPMEETYSTLVEWTLEPTENGGTVLHLRESGFKAEAHRKENDGGWTHELGELREYLEAA